MNASLRARIVITALAAIGAFTVAGVAAAQSEAQHQQGSGGMQGGMGQGMGGMGMMQGCPMMGSMTLAGWLGMLLIGVLLIAVAVALVRMLSPKSIDGGGTSIALVVLAVIGVLALLGVGGMLFMHWGMGGMSCCG